MAYKYLNDNGLKAYTKKVKGALKDLHTPIAISTLNTAESNAQNVRNIADFIAKAKAAGIADVNGMAVTCIIDNNYSGVGYIDTGTLCGIEIFDDFSDPRNFKVDPDGTYGEISILMENSSNIVTSNMLTPGARKPIILTSETTEVDEETYQKLLTDDVDVMFKLQQQETTTFIPLVLRVDKGRVLEMLFTLMYQRGYDISQNDIYIAIVDIKSLAPHTCDVITVPLKLGTVLNDSGYLNKSTISPVLQEISLIGTDAERKAKLDKFEADWKALTGASDMNGARFVGYYSGKSSDPGNNETILSAIMVYDSNEGTYKGFTIDDSGIIRKVDLGADGNFGAYNLFSDVDAIKYSYTPVPLTATTSTNKTQLDLFLSKVQNAQVMHCTYKDVYAGTLHKINGSWYGVLVGESNTLAGQLSIKLQADGTIVEGTA